MKDQTSCPKCHRLYCEGYWGEGVCIADMAFSRDPTARGDEIGDYVRQWYERNRESWWSRHRPQFFSYRDNSGVVADNFILAMIGEVGRVQREADRQMADKKSGDSGASSMGT